MGMETKRISQTVLKSPEGFRAQIPGLDLATLIQMAASHRGRMVVRVRSEAREGFLYFEEGRLVHANAEALFGEPAVTRMLAWTHGEFAVCQRPWPRQTTIHATTEALLIRAAHARDEAEASELQPPRELKANARPLSGSLVLSAPTPLRPEPVPVEKRAMIASVRIDMNGEIVTEHGSHENLAALTAYVTRIGALLGVSLGLEAFDAMHVELGATRLLVFADGSEMVGLMMSPGPAVNELRQQLSV
jgi:hypothetical protein